MRDLISRLFCRSVAIVLLLYSSVSETAESVRYRPIPRDLVETRLSRYTGDNKQREATLKQMFAEAGCDDRHISEQPVKGSKPPNILCILPGSSDKVIIVGAHFDYVRAGDGVVDNWSGASLLPSLYEAIKIEPRKHTYIFIGFTDEELGEVGSRLRELRVFFRPIRAVGVRTKWIGKMEASVRASATTAFRFILSA